MQKSNGLDLGEEPQRIKLCRVPTGEQEIHSKTPESRFSKSTDRIKAENISLESSFEALDRYFLFFPYELNYRNSDASFVHF